MSTSEHLHIVVIGAGLSGINAGYRIQSSTAYGNDYAILESRPRMGGTWDFFKYPGIRSDSDMYTLGFSFRPWTDEKSIADGSDILKYIKDTASEFKIDQKIRYNHKLVSADWSSENAQWTLEIDVTSSGETTRKQITANFVYFCAGYYRYDAPYKATIPGIENFKNTVIHPQFWPEDLDYTGKKVVIIGSGATAVTLLPNMADTAGHVTMLQRTPSYFVVLPTKDWISKLIRLLFPRKVSHAIMRLRMTAISYMFLYFCRLFPNAATKLLRKMTALQLPKNVPLDPHFKPPYKPWDQRLCLVPDGDFFKALRSGKASIATDNVETFTENGIKLKSGETLEADIVVTATGLSMVMVGGASLSIDGNPVKLNKTWLYKGQMLADIPNMGICLGYTNASWSLGSDLACRYFVRVINYMDANKYDVAVPRCKDGELHEAPLLNLKSGYVQRAAPFLPKAGDRAPWYMRTNWFYDWFKVKFGSVTDEMEYMSLQKRK